MRRLAHDARFAARADTMASGEHIPWAGPYAQPMPVEPSRTLVSACLAGAACRYDGRARPDAGAIALVNDGAIPVCAEVLAGFSTPRPAAEIVSGDGEDVLDGRARVIENTGEDVTQAFIDGARRAADLATQRGVTHAVLQGCSPSCGCTSIYDGTNTGTQRPGMGVFAAELRRRGLTLEERRGRAI